MYVSQAVPSKHLVSHHRETRRPRASSTASLLNYELPPPPPNPTVPRHEQIYSDGLPHPHPQPSRRAHSRTGQHASHGKQSTAPCIRAPVYPGKPNPARHAPDLYSSKRPIITPLPVSGGKSAPRGASEKYTASPAQPLFLLRPRRRGGYSSDGGLYNTRFERRFVIAM